METKAEGLQVAEWEGWCAQSPWDVLLHVRGIHGNTGERGTVRPPPDDSLEGASIPVLWGGGGTLRHRGVGELARWVSCQVARGPASWSSPP